MPSLAVRTQSWSRPLRSTPCCAIMSPVANSTPPDRHWRGSVDEVATRNRESADMVLVVSRRTTSGPDLHIPQRVRADSRMTRPANPHPSQEKSAKYRRRRHVSANFLHRYRSRLTHRQSHTLRHNPTAQWRFNRRRYEANHVLHCSATTTLRGGKRLQLTRMNGLASALANE